MGLLRVIAYGTFWTDEYKVNLIQFIGKNEVFLAVATYKFI